MAVMYVDVETLVDNMIAIAMTNSVGYLLAEVLTDWKDDNPDFLDLELSVDDLNALLKEHTCCIVGTGTNVSCYPTGLTTAILFDLDGNPL